MKLLIDTRPILTINLLMGNKTTKFTDDKMVEKHVKQQLGTLLISSLVDIVWNFYSPVGTRLVYSAKGPTNKLYFYNLVTQETEHIVNLPRFMDVEKIFLLTWRTELVFLVAEWEIRSNVPPDSSGSYVKDARGYIFLPGSGKWIQTPVCHKFIRPRIIGDKLYNTQGGCGGPYHSFFELTDEKAKWQNCEKYPNEEVKEENILLGDTLYSLHSTRTTVPKAPEMEGKMEEVEEEVEEWDGRMQYIVVENNKRQISLPVTSFFHNYNIGVAEQKRFYVIGSKKSYYFQLPEHPKEKSEMAWKEMSSPLVHRNWGKILPLFDGLLLVGGEKENVTKIKCEYWNSATDVWKEIYIPHLSDLSTTSVVIY